MSLVSTGSAAGSTHTKPSFTRAALGAAIGLVLSANAFAGFPTLYGKLQLTAGQYDFEKLDFPLTAPGATTYRNTGATDVTTELDSFTVESIGSRLGTRRF
jgi:hypothetical protein